MLPPYTQFGIERMLQLKTTFQLNHSIRSVFFFSLSSRTLSFYSAIADDFDSQLNG